jgi:hypothetical protein
VGGTVSTTGGEWDWRGGVVSTEMEEVVEEVAGEMAMRRKKTMGEGQRVKNLGTLIIDLTYGL